MKNIWILLTKYNDVFLFILFFGIAVWLVINNNDFQRASTLNSSNALIGKIYAESSRLTDYMKLDEANQELAYYTTARELVENNIVKYPIEPAAMSMILDTALTNRDQAIQTLAAQVKSLQDDVLILQADNNRLQQALESMAQANADPEKLVKELRQLKSLLDSEIITQEEFDIKKAKLLAKWE